ncbi:MAG: hypothetical protein COB17_09135 [Sulfurimonas sp.]|nr:MAG: hypothetical protein COB17_09135 [Sulfurimonas sp.]
MGIDMTHKLEQSNKFAAGHYKEAADLALNNIDTDLDIDKSNLLATLKAGNNLFYAKDYEKSINLFDDAENIIKYHREDTLSSTTSDYLAKIILNDSVVDYQGTITDAVMINTYKSLNYMASGKFSEARVELNRAIDRQRRAKDTYAQLISKQQDALNEKKRQKEGKSFAKTLESRQTQSIIRRNYSSLYVFKAYPDFINPFTTYLAGLYFIIDGDYTKAASLLKETYGMMPKCEVVESDFLMVENILAGKRKKEKYVWVIYENGLGPIKKQYKVHIPVYLVSDSVTYTGIALPYMKTRSRATADMNILSHNKVIATTELVSDMDRVILTEFKYSYNDILQRALLSTFVKTYAQYKIHQKNEYLGLAMSMFQFATTQADTRVWDTMPKDFQVAKVKMPKNHKLELQAGRHNINVTLAKDAQYSIVYVRIPTSKSKPSISVINF